MTERAVAVGDFRRLVLDRVHTLLETMTEDEKLKAAHGFVKREPTPLLHRRRPAGALERARRRIARAGRDSLPVTGLVAAAGRRDVTHLRELLTDVID